MEGKTSVWENALLVLLVLLVILSVAYMIYSLYGTNSEGTNNQAYQKAIQAENRDDICTTPAGYSDEAWRTHMSHHPDRYRQCLS